MLSLLQQQPGCASWKCGEEYHRAKNVTNKIRSWLDSALKPEQRISFSAASALEVPLGELLLGTQNLMEYISDNKERKAKNQNALMLLGSAVAENVSLY